LLKTVPPKLYPYYKKEVNEYFKRIENFQWVRLKVLHFKLAIIKWTTFVLKSRPFLRI
jgi:hypothetical protein